jgi:hypothetical protein
MSSDESRLRCSKMVTGGYDWVDRIVLNAFFLIVDRHGLPGHFFADRGTQRRPGGQPSFDIHPCVSAKVPR